MSPLETRRNQLLPTPKWGAEMREPEHGSIIFQGLSQHKVQDSMAIRMMLLPVHAHPAEGSPCAQTMELSLGCSC